jgi:hypothetical protein
MLFFEYQAKLSVLTEAKEQCKINFPLLAEVITSSAYLFLCVSIEVAKVCRAMQCLIRLKSAPNLQVEQISRRKEGKFGLWIDGNEGGFKNVKVMRAN